MAAPVRRLPDEGKCQKTEEVRLASNCAGDENVFSFVADYAFNKHFDVYSGVTVSDLSGGLGSGVLNDSVTTVMTGARLKF